MIPTRSTLLREHLHKYYYEMQINISEKLGEMKKLRDETFRMFRSLKID